MPLLKVLVLCTIASLCLACSGGGDGNGGPTAPAVRRDVVVGFYVWNGARQRTIQEARLLLDDQVVATFTATGNGASGAFMTGTVRGVTTGTHTLTVLATGESRRYSINVS